jgi:hypothetical protein
MGLVRSFSTTSRPASGRPPAALGRQPCSRHRGTGLTLRARLAMAETCKGDSYAAVQQSGQSVSPREDRCNAPKRALTILIWRPRLARHVYYTSFAPEGGIASLLGARPPIGRRASTSVLTIEEEVHDEDPNPAHLLGSDHRLVHAHPGRFGEPPHRSSSSALWESMIPSARN